MKYTINDIAKLCKVGKSTVSRVLNKDPRVKESTRQNIQAVIDRLGFQPNRIARAMRGAADPVIGIILTRLNSPSESQTLRAILHELHTRHITPLIAESQFNVDQVLHYFKLFEQRQVDGIILFGFSELTSKDITAWKADLVVVARQYSELSCVFYDDENAVTALMQKLVNTGYRNIAYVGVNEQDETTGKLRNQSYLSFCESHNLPATLIQADLSIESAYQKTATLLNQPVDAVLCASSTLAIGAFKCLQENGQILPLAFIGQNDLLQYVAPNTINLDFGYPQAGKWAVELLLKQMDGDKTIEQRQVRFKSIDENSP